MDRPGREEREANLTLTQLMKQVEASVPQVRGRGVGGGVFIHTETVGGGSLDTGLQNTLVVIV